VKLSKKNSNSNLTCDFALVDDALHGSDHAVCWLNDSTAHNTHVSAAARNIWLGNYQTQLKKCWIFKLSAFSITFNILVQPLIKMLFFLLEDILTKMVTRKGVDAKENLVAKFMVGAFKLF
jgi:hypothetical protein